METHVEIASDKRQSKSARWGQERRLEFIDFRLLWDGRINRGELVAFFGISIQQASLDIARYMELAPQNLEYDKSEKVYRATSAFMPAITPPESQAFLNQLLGVAAGTLLPSMSFVGWRPPYDVVRFPTRPIRSNILVSVLWAIRDKEEIEFTYQSMRRPSATRRWIAPHAIAFDGSRWHARAWCYENNDFRDFVFSRIQEIHGSRKTLIDPRSDHSWHTFINVILRARDGLTEHQRLAIQADFGMQDGQLVISSRKALAFYLLRQLQLDRPPEQSIQAQPIELVNADELRPILEGARK
jgi:hypothetical protein